MNLTSTQATDKAMFQRWNSEMNSRLSIEQQIIHP